MITILPVHWQLTVLKVVGCVIVGGKWRDKTSIAVKRRVIKPRAIQCSLSLAISKIWPAGIFMNFYRISAHREYDSGTFLLIIVKRYYIAVCSLQLLSHTVTVPGVIFAAYSLGLIAYILYIIMYAHIIKIFEIIKYLILKIINLKVKYFNNYIL